MEIESRVVNGVLVLRPAGELDLHTAEKLRSEADRVLSSGEARDLVLNLDGVTFIDSSGLGAILGRYRLVSYHGGRACLVGDASKVKGVLELSGLLKIMALYPSERAALKRLRAEGRGA